MIPDLVEAATVLADVLTEQNAALERLDFAAAVALVPAKEAALLGVTAGRPDAPLTDRDPILLALGRRMAALVAENRTLLERAVTVQTRIVGIIVRAAAPPGPRQYAASGFNSQRRRASAVTLSSRA